MHSLLHPLHKPILRVSQLTQRQMVADLPGLGHRNPLRSVDARVAAEGIGHKTGDGKIYQVIGTEQLNPHNGAGQWRIDGGGEDGQKTEGGEQVARQAEGGGSRIRAGYNKTNFVILKSSPGFFSSAHFFFHPDRNLKQRSQH